MGFLIEQVCTDAHDLGVEIANLELPARMLTLHTSAYLSSYELLHLCQGS